MGRLMRRRRERGAVAVEAALLAPLLIIIAFGTIEIALLLRDYVSVTSLARSGARVASAEPRFGTVGSPYGHNGAGTTSSFAQDAADAMERAANTLPVESIQDIWVYLANPQGFPSQTLAWQSDTTSDFSSCPADTCVRYVWFDDPDDALPGRFTWQSGTWDPASINACQGETTTVQSVGVFVRANHPWVVGFFPGTGTVTGSTVMRFEPLNANHDSSPTWEEPTSTTPGTFAGCKP